MNSHPPAKTHCNDRYLMGTPPWDMGRHDMNLATFLLQRPYTGGRALVIGCGTGENTLYLAAKGFAATGIDVSPRALEVAHEKSAAREIAASFVLHDISRAPLSAELFDFIFDRGCLHIFSSDGEQQRVVAHVAASARPGALWLTLVASADQPSDGSGPPRHTAASLTAALEPSFQILSLEAAYMDSNRDQKLRIWKVVSQRRA